MSGNQRRRGDDVNLTSGTRTVVELGTQPQPVLIRICTREGGGVYDAYALRSTDGWVFIDPLRPTPEGADRLRHLIRERPVATVLTSDGHERFAFAVRDQWGTPVWGPTPGEPGEGQRDVAYERHPDHLYVEGDVLPGGLRAIKLAGMWRGDHALLWQAPTGERVLFSGDILNGQVETDLADEDHHRREPGLYFGARPRYVARHANPAALKASLERLLHEEFDVIAGAHSRLFRDDPKAALAQLIETI